MSSAILLLLFLLLMHHSHSYEVPTDGPSAALTARYRSRPPPPTDALTYFLAEQYPAWHRQYRNSARRLVYTFNHTQPGLGDRFRGLLTAYLQAAFSHRVLLLNWEFPFSVFDYLSPSGSMRIRYATADRPRRGSVFRCTSRVRCAAEQLGPMLGRVDTVMLSDSELARPELVIRIARVYPLLPLSRAIAELSPQTLPTAPTLFTKLFATMFDADKSLRALLERQPHGLLVLKSPFVAVHARLGEGVGESKGRFALDDRQGMARCLATVAAEAGARQRVSRFYLATDTPSFLDTFRTALVRNVPGAQVVGGGGAGPVHTCHCGSEELGADERCLQTFLELLLLAKGSALIGSKSGFSEVASHIGNVSDYSVVALKECIKGKRKR